MILALVSAALLAIPIAFPRPAAAMPVAPANFSVESLSPGLWFYVPTCLAYLPDGRLLVGEKRGRVYLVKNDVKLQPALWDGENEVLNEGDCGLMSIAVDPAYFTNHYVYFLYTVDPDTNGVDFDDNGFGRLVRYQMSWVDTNTIDPATRTVLLGSDWTHGPLVDYGSHTVGSLRFGRDGSLFVSIGEGASAGAVDAGGGDPLAFGPGKSDPAEDIGAFRSQYLGSLCGKILRIDPATGRGYPSNPFYDGDAGSVASRVWEYGLRNPFRFSVRPGTGSVNPALGDPGTLYIGDVGWLSWEEIDVTHAGGRNFGWPCYEGQVDNPGYQQANPPRASCATLGQPGGPGSLTFPLMSWSHDDPALSSPSGLQGNCVMNGVFYTGDRYPPEYRNRYFFADFGGNWLRTASVDSLDHLTAVTDFATDMDSPVDFAVNPVTGDVVYVSINYGDVRRIRYSEDSNQRPIAVASALPDTGRAPLDVTLSSAGSFDPEGSRLSYAWAFGDGATSDLPNPLHTYAGGGAYVAVLAVTDSIGANASDTVVVRVSGPGLFPVTHVVDAFDRPAGPVGGLWVDNVAALVIADSALTQSGPPSPSAVWNGVSFGPDQEVYMTLRTIAPACRRYSLMLKVQGTTFTSGAIDVRYDQTLSTVEVSTYQPVVGWKSRGTLYPVTYAAGDRFGARAYRDGTVQVFRNQNRVGEVSLGNWAYKPNGGRIGLNLAGAAGSRLDDFGGGTIVAGPNTPPVAVIASPSPGAFYAEDDTVRLRSASTDGQEDGFDLFHQWQVDLLHNNHVHPAFFSSTNPEDAFVMHNHDDGTGVVYRVMLDVTDSGGLSDTASVMIYPEVDLEPSSVTVLPDPPGNQSPSVFRFTLRNLGGMPAPASNWILHCDDRVLAQGDTVVAAHDSIALIVTVPPGLDTGTHTLRVVVDSLDRVPEVNESNDTVVRPLLVIAGLGADVWPPAFIDRPRPEPYGVFAWIHWKTSEPSLGVVRFGPTLALADSIPVPGTPDMSHTVMLGNLAPASSYYFRVDAADSAGNRAYSAVDSFVTRSGPLESPATLPRSLELSNGSPNPSTGSVSFALALPHPARVQFRIYDTSGREVWREPDAYRAAGISSLRWLGGTVAGRHARPGLYFARVLVDGTTLRRRIVVVR